MTRFLQLTTLVLSLLMLAGCSLLFGPVKDKTTHYELTRVSHARFAANPHNVTLFVAAPSASAGFDTDNMIYTKQKYQIKSFAKNRWIASPALMLTPLIVQSLRNTGYFRAVVSSPVIGNTDFRLQTQIIELQQEFFQGRSQVRLVLQMTLLNSTTNNIIVDRRLETVCDVPQDTPYGGVIAANIATAETLQKLAKLCVQFAKKTG